MRVLHVLLPLLQVKLRQKGALLNKTRGFYSGVNGNRRANIPLRNERGEDPVPTIIISVTNREHRELFHYIMRHYIVLEKTALMASAFRGILLSFFKDFNPCSSCYA